MGIVQRAKDWLPPTWQNRLRESRWWTYFKAGRLARDAKRIDLCAAQLAEVMHLAGIPSLEGTTCLEVGCGWVMSHALVLHLMGAQRIYATDLLPIAQPSRLRSAIRHSISWVVRDQLAPFSSHHEVRARLDRVSAWDSIDLSALESLGLEYVAPLDLARSPFPHRVDFIYSNSVLEHVVDDQVPNLLANLAESLNPGGRMFHAIHLEDHRDFERRPFDFYTVPSAEYSDFDQSIRGNRIRASQWRRWAQELPHVAARDLFAWQRRDRPLPSIINPSIRHTGEDDLRTSHLGLFAQRDNDSAMATSPVEKKSDAG